MEGVSPIIMWFFTVRAHFFEKLISCLRILLHMSLNNYVWETYLPRDVSEGVQDVRSESEWNDIISVFIEPKITIFIHAQKVKGCPFPK